MKSPSTSDPLETSRLRLRRQTPDDAPFILELMNDPSFHEHIGDRGIHTDSEARGYIRRGAMASYEEHGFGLYLVERREDGRPVGTCGLIKRGSLDDIDLGFAFHSDFRGLGYATEASVAVLREGRDRYGLTRIVAIVSPANAASVRVLEKVGFAFERKIRMSGEDEDIDLYAALPRPQATRTDHADVFAITAQQVRQTAMHASLSSRDREILVLHQGDSDPLQRMLNALEPGSYVRPHRHLDPPKAEGIVILTGALGVVVFDEEGRPDAERFLLLRPGSEPRSGPATIGVDLRAGVWHTIFALEPGTVIYETKSGPYDPTTDKDFASWAPLEGTEAAARYLADLEDRFRRAKDLPPRVP